MHTDRSSRRSAHFKLHFYISCLLSLLHEAQTKGLEVDLMFGLFNDFSKQGTGSTQVIVLVGQQVLEYHGQKLEDKNKPKNIYHVMCQYGGRSSESNC